MHLTLNNLVQDVLPLWQYIYPLAFTNMALNLLYPLRNWYPPFERIDTPLDMRLHFIDGRPLLGRSTTIPGLFLVSILAIFFWFVLNNPFGLFLPFLTYAGHALGSFVKRRFGVADGKFVPVVDHGDYVILAGVICASLGIVPLRIAGEAVVLTLLVQPLVTYCGYLLGIRKFPL